MNWGKSIILSFVLFAIFVAALVYVCVSQDINLVTSNYYSEEIAYQKQIERMQNTKTLEILPSISIQGDLLSLEYSDLPRVTSGKIDLFRPSDTNLDQKFSINQTENTSLQFQLSAIAKGLYKARFTWTMNEKEYYYEKIIVL